MTENLIHAAIAVCLAGAAFGAASFYHTALQVNEQNRELNYDNEMLRREVEELYSVNYDLLRRADDAQKTELPRMMMLG
jgi:hypothetical protein